MPEGTPQTTYNLDNKAVVAGQVIPTPGQHIDSRPCGAVDLDEGVAVELVNGVLVIAQGTGNPSVNPLWGVTCYKDSKEPGKYKTGEQVPVLRRGLIAARLDAGVTVVEGATANYTHSSTSNAKGTFTNAAASGSAGSEISSSGGTFFKDVGLVGSSPSLAIVELNLP